MPDQHGDSAQSSVKYQTDLIEVKELENKLCNVIKINVML